MKPAFIFVLYKTPVSEIKRLKNEIKELNIPNSKTYFIDNTRNNRGYAGGVNEGIKRATDEGFNVFVVANPDISLTGLQSKPMFKGLEQFDICGFKMIQDGKSYYGGAIDKWRMSGGLIEKKPKTRFVNTDFISGSLIIIKKSVVEKIGLWDESFFLYYEEVDFCERARRAGFKVGLDSLLTYTHFETSKGSSAKTIYLFKNRIKFLLKYGSLKQKAYEILRIPKTIYEEVVKRPFYLNFFSLNFASLVNKILHFGLFLVLIRTFPPEDFAVYTLAWTHVGLLSPLLDFGTTSYGLVYLSGRKKENISTLFSFRVILSLITLVLTLVLAFLFGYPPRIMIPIVLTSVIIIANMFSGTFLIQASIANKSYLVSVVTLIFQAVLVITLIAAVLLTKQMIWVFIMTFVLYLGYSLVNFKLIKKNADILKLTFDIKSWSAIAKKSMVFLIISLLAGFYSKADVLLLNFLRGEKEVGLYSAGYRFLSALMFIVVAYNVSAMPIFAKLAKAKKKKLFVSKIKKDIVLLSIIGGIIALSFNLFSPYVLPWFMKGDYAESISVLRIIIFALPLILLTSVFLNSLYALKRAKTVVMLFLFQVIYSVVFNYIFIPLYGYMASSWITLAGESANTIISFIILKHAINEDLS